MATIGSQSVCQAEEEPQEQSDAPVVAGPGARRSRQVQERNCGGHECEFVLPPPDYLQVECSICQLVLRAPHLTSCCGHNFCKECIDRVQEAGKCCPLCNAEQFTLMYNRAHDIALKTFEVYCTHRMVGCEWKGKLEMLDNHLNVSPKFEKQLEGCAFVEVQCYHDGCWQSFQRQLITRHQSEECSQRPFTCGHCRTYKATYCDVATKHWPVCKCYPVSCPHNCTQKSIQRQNLEHHLKKECPLQEVECEFKYVGCETKLSRKDMLEHMNMNVTSHMTLLAQQNRELMAKLLEKEEELGKMKERIAELENKVSADGGINELKDRVLALERSVKTEEEQEKLTLHLATKRELNELLQKQNATSNLLEKLHHHVLVAPIQLVMPNFRQHKMDKEQWFSEGFYTHPRGYKMCLMVDAIGEVDGKSTYVSCFIHLMQGDFDNHLKWPFQGDVTVQLLNQREDNNHNAHIINFAGINGQYGARVTSEETATWGWGCPQLIPHSDLDYSAATNCQYLMNNRLYFRVQVEVL